MKISIIIPIYNVAPYVERCLYSALNQSYENIELVLVDDCGTDNSMNIVSEVVEKYVGNKKILLFKHEHNLGLSAARNTGIKNATGDYLLFLDSDDEIPLNAVELLLEATNENPDFVIGNIKVLGSDKFSFYFSIPSGVIQGNELILDSFIKDKWYSMAVNKLIKKEFLLNHHLFFKEGILHEDELWSFILATKANKMSVVKDYTYHYYIRNDSITGKISIRNYESNAIILCEKKKIIDEINNVDFHSYMMEKIVDFYYSLLVFRPSYNKLVCMHNLLKKNMNTLHLKDLSTSYKVKYLLFRLPCIFFKFICR
jgi:glycosyltransferase involved in cell wall biosynthesis